MRAAQELLGALTIGGGSARPGGGGGGSQSQIILPSRPECPKTALIDLKITKNVFFYVKVLYKIYSQDIF
jgi:hypothetical protein